MTRTRPPGSREDGPPLRIALLSYRGNPRSGGQGVYVRNISRELARLGHSVTVFSGQPWPDLDDLEVVRLEQVPSLGMYEGGFPFRWPSPGQLRDWVDLVEVATLASGGFAEPRTFSIRAWQLLRGRRADWDLVHDNQSFGSGLLGLVHEGWPVVATCHHPLTVDRLIDSHQIRARWQEWSQRRWYGFIRMQKAVARRLDRVLAVSSGSRRDLIEQMGVRADRTRVVNVGTDIEVFRPAPGGIPQRLPGRIMTTASADVPLKGLEHLLQAVAALRTARPEAHLVVVGECRSGGPTEAAVRRLGLGSAVTFRPGLSEAELVECYRQASVVAVPSLYEGFSLPAVEAMACEAPLVATDVGGLPEVVGRDGETGLLVPPGDGVALAGALDHVLSDIALAGRMGRAGRRRVAARFTWSRCAKETVECYREVLERSAPAKGGARGK